MHRYLIMLLCFLTLSACSPAETDSLSNEPSINHKMNAAPNEPWSISEASRVLHDSIHPSYGIEDPVKFQQIIDRKNAKDLNAMYIYAEYLLGWDPGASEQTTREGLELLWSLVEQKHPFASGFLAGVTYLDTYKNFLKEKGVDENHLLEARIKWYQIAIQGGGRLYSDYADLLMFGNEPYVISTRLLAERKVYKHDPIFEKIAFDNYMIAVTQGHEAPSGSRIAEAYYLGVGVPKNIIRAYAWARLMSERTLVDSTYATNRYAHQLYRTLSSTLSVEQLKQGNAYYERLKIEVPYDPKHYMSWTQGWDAPKLPSPNASEKR